MNAEEQIRKLGEFLDENYKAELVANVRKGESFLIVDFSLLTRFDPEVAEALLEQPEDIVKAAEVAVEGFDIDTKNFRIRFTNLPESQKIKIKDIRSKHLGKLLVVSGIVRQKSDVRPQVTSAKFECPSCGNIINILQLDSNFREPTRCGCGRKGKFRLVEKDLIDAQGLVLEEDPEFLEGGEQPKRINVILKEDLVSPLSERKTNPGSKVTVVGQVKEVPIMSKMGNKSTRYDLIIEANCIEGVEETFYDIKITEEEIRQIKEISEDARVYERLIGSIAPSIYGYDRVKEALILQLMGGSQKIRTDGIISRGDIHVLLVGDPGAGKSQLLKRINLVAPKGRYVSGKGVSGAGLTAAVVRDEFLKGWSLEAGALVLASNGICCIDELDKMGHEDRAAMHEALEQQTISISKANIQATLLARTTVLAAANPKLGRFDSYALLASQIDLPPTLINRFDLIFPIKDIPNKKEDEKMASHILRLHQKPEIEEPEIPTKLLKKYIAYARQNIRPVLTDGALKEIQDYYVTMRSKAISEDMVVRAIPITPRQLEASVRLAEASAKVRLSDKVTRKDARRAIDIINYCLREVGLDKETGEIDIDRISTGIPATERSKIVVVRDIIAELEKRMGKIIPIDDVRREASSKGLDDAQLDEAIEKLKRSGDLYEPRRGFLSRI